MSAYYSATLRAASSCRVQESGNSPTDCRDCCICRHVYCPDLHSWRRKRKNSRPAPHCSEILAPAMDSPLYIHQQLRATLHWWSHAVLVRALHRSCAQTSVWTRSSVITKRMALISACVTFRPRGDHLRTAQISDTLYQISTHSSPKGIAAYALMRQGWQTKHDS